MPIYFRIKYVKPLFKDKVQWVLAILSVIVCAWFGYYVLNHLPAKDFRAYRIGVNITEGMSIPDDAPKPVIDYHWTFSVNGEDQVITTRGSYPDVNGEFLNVETETIEEGYEPAIYDFAIESEDGDFTDEFLSKENVVMIVSYSLEKMTPDGARAIKLASDKALQNGYTVIGLSASGRLAKDRLEKEYGISIPFYLCDEKALKAVVRSNPGVLVLDKGTVKQKVHWKDIENLIFK